MSQLNNIQVAPTSTLTQQIAQIMQQDPQRGGDDETLRQDQQVLEQQSQPQDEWLWAVGEHESLLIPLPITGARLKLHQGFSENSPELIASLTANLKLVINVLNQQNHASYNVEHRWFHLMHGLDHKNRVAEIEPDQAEYLMQPSHWNAVGEWRDRVLTEASRVSLQELEELSTWWNTVAIDWKPEDWIRLYQAGLLRPNDQNRETYVQRIAKRTIDRMKLNHLKGRIKELGQADLFALIKLIADWQSSVDEEWHGCTGGYQQVFDAIPEHASPRDGLELLQAALRQLEQIL